jgi:hypothetical protein
MESTSKNTGNTSASSNESLPPLINKGSSEQAQDSRCLSDSIGSGAAVAAKITEGTRTHSESIKPTDQNDKTATQQDPFSFNSAQQDLAKRQELEEEADKVDPYRPTKMTLTQRTD